MNTRRFRTEISQMSSEKKTEWILNAITEIERLEDELKVCRRQILKLDKKNNELNDDSQGLILEDDAAAHTRTPSVNMFTPRKYRKGTSMSTPTPTGIRKRYITADWRTTGRPDTPQLTGKRVYKSGQDALEIRNTLFGESRNPYSLKKRPTTPPRKTTSRKGGSIKQTLRNRRKVFK